MAWREFSDDAQHWAFWGGVGLAVIAAIAAGAYWDRWSYLWNVPPPIRGLIAIEAAVAVFVLWFLVALIVHRYFGWPHPFYRLSLSGQLVIHSARYGIGGNDYKDVTTLLKGHIENNRIDTPLVNALFPPHDPFPGLAKHLVVVYSIGNWPRIEIVCHEGKRLTVPAASDKNFHPTGAREEIAATADDAGDEIKVRATQTGYYGDIRRREGDVFTIRSEAEFSTMWMERVPLATPEKQTTSAQALRRTEAKLRGKNPDEADQMRINDLQQVVTSLSSERDALIQERDAALADLKDRTHERDRAREAFKTAKREIAYERLKGYSKMVFPGGVKPTVTIRSVAYGNDYALVREIQKILNECTDWAVTLDGSNNPMLPQADKCKVVFESGLTLSFDPVAHAFADGDLLGVPVCRGSSDHSDNYRLVINVLPSAPS